MEGLRKGSHQVALEREAQRQDLLWEAERQTRVRRVDPRWDRLRRVDPRWDRLVELNAEARGPKKGKRKAETLEGLLNRPKKGGLNLMKDARKRRLMEPRGSPPRAIRLTAELESRPLLMSRRMRKKGIISTDLDRS